MELSKFILVLDIVKIIFWNSLPVGAMGREGAYSSWITVREHIM